MDRYKIVYLTGLIPVLIFAVISFLWLLTAQPLVGWIGLLLMPLCCLLSLAGCFMAYKYYTAPGTPDETKLRSRHLPGHCLILGLGLAFSYQGTQYLLHNPQLMQKSEGLVIRIKNTSARPAQGLKIQVGTLNETVKEIPAYGEQIINTRLAYETNLTAEINAAGTLRKAVIRVGPNDHKVLVRLDVDQNILPEVN